jgi:hypothetical protein
VQVTAEAPLLQTDSSTVSTLVTQNECQDLPVNGRNFIRLVQFEFPARTKAPRTRCRAANRPDDRRQTSAISINGAGDNQNNLLIDGMDNNERAIGTIVVKPSMDALAEVRVQTNMYRQKSDARPGRRQPAHQIGDQRFHGSAFGFFRTIDSTRATTSRNMIRSSSRNSSGRRSAARASNRTFFFADYEGFRQRHGQVNNLTVPTLAMRNGDFSELSQTIYDPRPSGRRLPATASRESDRRDRRALRALFPSPTSPGLANNYSSTTIRTQNSTTADGRIDHRLDDKNSLWGRFSL